MDSADQVEGLGPQECFAAGMVIFSEANSSSQLDRAIALIEAASAHGVPDATEKCALFEAIGIARPPSWARALDQLQLAAEQGSTIAQGQLLILAKASPNLGQQAPADQADWRSVRDRINLEQLLGSGERQPLSETPRVRIIRGFASPAECHWLIECARPRLKPAMIYDCEGRHVVDPARSNSAIEFHIPDMDLVIEIIRNRISRAVRVPLAMFELTQFFHYEPGQEFKLHHDFLDPSNPEHRKHLDTHGQRIATFLIYLNEQFEGGETDFPKAGIRFRGTTGDAIFWANVGTDGEPDLASVHTGRPPSSGEKWVLSQWIRDRAATPSAG
jgi:prolyl 4-hydroxylase